MPAQIHTRRKSFWRPNTLVGLLVDFRPDPAGTILSPPLSLDLKERLWNQFLDFRTYLHSAQLPQAASPFYGIALDASPSQFCAGELEATIANAFMLESPDVILIEGQGALSHPAFSTSSFILRGACPDGVVLQHAPGSRNRCDFPQMTMPTPATEINLIETFSKTKVIGVTINHENMTDAEVSSAILRYENELGIPATNALTRPPGHLVEMILRGFPKLKEKLSDAA